ncbi:rhodanese-like domain-containing protein [Stenotrophomonas sp. ATCM1_4]|uniref:Rhodanese-like domain-containing protein n=2 Tax=Stenotrophomonas capsici TaxID=3110230 RepID=A0ABU5V458_9GAMM|nr:MULTISPECIES: rhodanese-like domain-containing protein [unclassified Stenotrophomonas]MEA5668143.1 rhodanese-like domain-containing protein [Stenotrophomonas sp. MH1]TDB26310.1 rhodanese-like domain-containing protein [Stenotrophomonas sp. ATCM1_4]
MNYEELLAFAGRNPMLSLALVGLTVAIIATEVARLFRGYKSLKPSELTHLINAGGAVVIDLSAASDFEKGHIVGSRNLQPAQVSPTHKLLAPAKQSPVVLLCRTGNASATAAKVLKKAGFEQVYVLDGGLPAWQAADLPLVKGRG